MSLTAQQPAAVSTLDAVRESCAWVAGQAEHVRIRADKIPVYTQFILDKYPVITAHDEHHLVSDDAEETVAYILALDSVNFGSGYFLETGLEYRDVAGGLKAAFLRGEMNTAEKWVAVTAEDCLAVFAAGKPRHEMTDALMTLFARRLNFTGRIVLEKYQGRALGLVEAAEGSAARLVDIVSAWETFRDVPVYKGREVPILKRAQIFAAHLELTGLTNFRDMDQLTCFADNMVPHVLHCDGILEYTPALAGKIEQGLRLVADSPEEIEIRAAAVHAVELMKAAASRAVTSPNIDHILWNRGYEPEIYARPSHQTLTAWY